MTEIHASPQGNPPLLDVHAHFVPDWYVAHMREKGFAVPDGMPAWPAWSIEAHLALMHEVGVSRSLLSLSSPGVSVAEPALNDSLAQRVNDFAAEVRCSAPDDFGFLASLPLPDMQASLREATRALDDLGAEGVILLTNSRGTYLTDPSHEPLWELLAERGCPVLLHPTSPVGHESTSMGLPRPLMEFLFDTTRVVVRMLMDGVVDRHPGVRLIVPHSGSMVTTVAHRAAMFQELTRDDSPPTRFAESVSPLMRGLDRLWWDLAGSPTAAHLGALRQQVGLDKVLYGSDFCFTPPQAVHRQIDLLENSWPKVDPQPWRERLRRNASELLTPRLLPDAPRD